VIHGLEYCQGMVEHGGGLKVNTTIYLTMKQTNKKNKIKIKIK
jgi:hypothetical protein